jgi:hypothetical protein
MLLELQERPQSVTEWPQHGPQISRFGRLKTVEHRTRTRYARNLTNMIGPMKCANLWFLRNPICDDFGVMKKRVCDAMFGRNRHKTPLDPV